MKKSILFVLFAIIALSSTAGAWNVAIMMAGSGAAAPAGETVLVGTNAAYTEGPSALGANVVYGDRDGFTSVASGNISGGRVYAGSTATTKNFKMLVYDSGLNLIATSNPTTTWNIGQWTTFTFSSGSIVSGNKYYLGIIADGAFSLYTNVDGATWKMLYDNAGSYAYPPDPLTTEGTALHQGGGMYVYE